MSKEAMKQALKALKAAWNDEECSVNTHIAVKGGIIVLEEALAKQEQGEPVAEVKRNSSGQIYIDWRDGESAIVNLVGTVLYTTPPQRKPLTKSQVLDLWEQTYVQRGSTGIEFARAIEAAHGIKE